MRALQAKYYLRDPKVYSMLYIGTQQVRFIGDLLLSLFKGT